MKVPLFNTTLSRSQVKATNIKNYSSVIAFSKSQLGKQEALVMIRLFFVIRCHCVHTYPSIDARVVVKVSIVFSSRFGGTTRAKNLRHFTMLYVPSVILNLVYQISANKAWGSY